MFRVLGLGEQAQFADAYLTSRRGSFLAVVESVLYKSEETALLQAQLLRSVADGLTRQPPEPEAVASRLDDLLKSERRPAPAICYFAGVTVGDQMVKIAWAGDIRVHLISKERVVSCTQDHIFANEKPTREFEEMIRSNPYNGSRWLGERATRPAEIAIWPREEADSIVICSSHFHEYRSPDEYIPTASVAAKTTGGYVAELRLKESLRGTA